MFDDKTETKLVTNVLIWVSIRELHNSLVSDPNDGGIKMLGTKMLILLPVILHYVQCCYPN